MIFLDELWHGENIDTPQISQPLCTAIQIALVDLLKSFGVTPDAVVGHSSGEIAAAYTTGALSHHAACRVAYHRGRLAAKLIASSKHPSAMMSVNISEERVPEYLKKFDMESQIGVACINSPFNTTLSGDELALDRLKERLDESKIFCKKLNTGVAYHSPEMAQVSSEYLSCLQSLESQPAFSNGIFMVSSVTGQPVSPYMAADGEYWVNNLVSPVRFADALNYLVVAAPRADGLKDISHYLEIGPHGALQRPIKDSLRQFVGTPNFSYVSTLSRFDSPLKTVLEVVGHLFMHGFPISVTAANQQDNDQSPPFLTDIPIYPFDHSRLYWHESNRSREWRLREARPRALLGVRAADWNPLEPRWRVTLSIDDMPWIADHVVGEHAIFPAAGTVMIALEAVKEMSNKQKRLLAYNIKEATFMNPIVVLPESETEVMVILRPLQQVYEKSAFRFEVRIFARAGDHWNQCFMATIYTEYDEGLSEVDAGLEVRAAVQRMVRKNDYAKETSKSHVSKDDFYERLGQHGLKYGECFSLVDDIFWDGNQEAVARIDFKSLVQSLDGTVHPAVLDAAFQMCFVAPSDGMSRMLPTVVPHKIQDLWMSHDNWKRLESPMAQVVATSRLRSTELGVQSSLAILADDGSLLCRVGKLDMSPIMGEQTQSRDQRTVVHRIDWKPSLSMNDPTQLQNSGELVQVSDDEKSAVSYSVELEDTLRAVLQQNIDILRVTEGSRAPSHIQKYVSWMNRQLQQKRGRTKEEMQLSGKILTTCLDELIEARPSWRLYIEVARNLVGLVRGEVDPLELFYSTSVARDLYDDFYKHMCNNALVSYLELHTHQTPGQRILEVGAGTGGLTHHVLSSLQQIEERTGGVAFTEYTFTDVSGAFFEKATERFSEYQDRMAFKVFNIEKDIETQGFQPGLYDLILAGDCLHVAADLVGTLKRIRSLLKPGGRLIFRETTAPDCFVMGFGFGVLPDWWRNEEAYREWGPTITTPQWHSVLRESGFSGNDLVIKDYQNDAAHIASTIVSTAEASEPREPEGARTLLVVRDGDDYQLGLATSLASEPLAPFEHQRQIFNLSQLPEANVASADRVLFLADIGKPILDRISEREFNLMQEWIKKSPNVLWVAATGPSGDPSTVVCPHIGLQQGFLRTVRTELDRPNGIISLMVEDDAPDRAALVRAISAVFKSAFGDMLPDVEYVLRDGHILTGRLVEDCDVGRQLVSSTTPEATLEPWLPGPPLTLKIETRGQLESLRFVQDVEHHNELDANDVEIEAKAWALNFRDVFAALGRLESDSFGSDCAGVVTRVGSQCTSVKPGDRVCMFTFGCMRTYPRSEESCVSAIPDSVTFEEACGVINPALTAWQSLVELARIKKGDKVLIHSASGATGQLAIQIAKLYGAEVFATVGYDHKKQLLIDEYGIDPDHIFYSRDTSFAKGVERMTNGRGVDVVLNSLVGEGLRASWECIAPFGRFVEIGKADIEANASLPMACFAKSATFAAMDLIHVFTDQKAHGQSILRKVMELFKSGSIRSPRPLQIYGVDAVEDAFRHLQGGKTSGRIIIRVEPSTMVQVCTGILIQW